MLLGGAFLLTAFRTALLVAGLARLLGGTRRIPISDLPPVPAARSFRPAVNAAWWRVSADGIPDGSSRRRPCTPAWWHATHPDIGFAAGAGGEVVPPCRKCCLVARFC